MMEQPFKRIKGDMFVHPFQPLAFGDYKQKDNFPYCCSFHRNVMLEAEDFAERFPNCCDVHRKFALKPYYNSAFYKYDGFAKDILVRLALTEYHMGQYIDKPDWYKEITDYIEYIYDSFGKPSVGDGVYTRGLRLRIELISKNIGQNKAQRLLDYINSKYERQPGESIAEKGDINKLYHIYIKWLAILPFNVFPFNDLKDRFTDVFPVFMEEPAYNRYTGLVKGTITTKKRLVVWLIDKTTQILKSANSVRLREQGLIHDDTAHKDNLIGVAHQIKQDALLNKFSKNERIYVQVINQWLANEIDYFEKVTSPKFNLPRIEYKSAQAKVDTREHIVNNMPFMEVKRLFMQLATKKNKDGGLYLTEDEVEEFMERAFFGKEFTEKLYINVGRRDKGDIVGLFHLFFTKSTTHLANTGKFDKNGKAEKYIHLLTGYFGNWSFEEIIGNFRKGGDW